MPQDANTTPDPNNGTPPETGAQGTGTTQTNTVKTFTQEEVDGLIRDRLARETKKYADYDTVKSELKRLKETGQTTEDTLKQQIKELSDKMTAAEAKATANLIRSAVVAAAARLDFNDPSDAYAMIDLSKLEVGDDGTVKGIDKALQALLADKPYLRKQAASKTSVTNPAGGTALTLERIKQMTPAEINANWAEVQKVLAGK